MEETVYLDNAATTFPKPQIVHDMVRDFYSTCGVNPGRTGCDIALKAEEMIFNTPQIPVMCINPRKYNWEVIFK